MRHLLTFPLLVTVLSNSTLLADTNNILANGGFEYGLMCYSNDIFNTAGSSYAGDYHFSLSSDAHSGAYSLQMACASGGDCGKAVIYSNRIPAPPNQAYKLSFYAKCPISGSATAYVAGMALPITCDGNWDLNQISFQSGAASGSYVYFAIYSFGVSSLLVDDVLLTFGDGTAPAHTVLHAGVRNVSISGQTVNVDGAPFLSLGFFDVGYNDLAQVAATGANTINGLPNYNATDCFNTGQTSYPDRIYQLGLNFVPDSTTTAELRVPAVFPSVTQTFAPHLANIAWFLADEPDQANVDYIYVPPATFLAESTAAKTKTSLPMVADFQRAAWSTASEDAPYNGSADIWMAEPYGTDFSTVNHAVNLFNSIQARPIWLAQDAIDPSLIVPKAYWAIISGVTGIHYFTWDNFKASAPTLAAATQVFSELNGLKNVIFGQKMDALVTAPSGIASMARLDPSSGAIDILAANSTSSTVQGNFLVQGLTAGQTVTVLYENRSITAIAGSFTDTFAGVSRHVYSFKSTAASQLAFTAQPSTGVAGTAISPVIVQVQDLSGNLVSGSNASVTVTSNPAGVNATVMAMNGVATFSNLAFILAGNYTLSASSTALTGATSNSFTIGAGLPSKLVIKAQPVNTIAGATMPAVVVQVQDAYGNLAATSNASVTITSAPAGVSATVAAANGVAVFAGLTSIAAGTYTFTASATGLTPATSGSFSITILMTATKVGVVRSNVAFLEDTNGNGAYDPGVDRFIANFTGPGGFVAGDAPVVGDWTGDGKAKVGIYRASTGTWFLDANNNGILDAGDLTYQFGGVAGDTPFVGDWNGLGKSCIGLFRQGFFWVLDLDCNGSFDGTKDAAFPFGGLGGDVPVVGAWTGGTTKVGVVRKYAPGGVPQGDPFYWVLDAGAANAGGAPANHQPDYGRVFAFGGLTGDVFITGDWFNTGISAAGVYRTGFWVLDAALPGAPQASHVPGLTFGYGGVAGDVPVTGKW
jgi:hypothetical protein